MVHTRLLLVSCHPLKELVIQLVDLILGYPLPEIINYNILHANHIFVSFFEDNLQGFGSTPPLEYLPHPFPPLKL